jgi:hypothetical protein
MTNHTPPTHATPTVEKISLFDVLVLIAGASALGGGYAAISLCNGGYFVDAVAGCVCLMIAFVSVVAEWKIVVFIKKKSRNCEPKFETSILVALLLCELLWVATMAWASDILITYAILCVLPHVMKHF